jgi:hypothetical protein
MLFITIVGHSCWVQKCKNQKADVRNKKVEKTNIVIDNMGGDNVPNIGQTFMSSLLSILDNAI